MVRIKIFEWINTQETELLKSKQLIDSELEVVQQTKAFLQEIYFHVHFKKIFDDYLIHIEAYCNWGSVDGGTPNESLMRSIEELIGISENAKRAFREEIIIRASAACRKGKKFTWDSDERLKKAIQRLKGGENYAESR